jgi:DNA repair exonuclease SbcCD ATPase subunit
LFGLVSSLTLLYREGMKALTRDQIADRKEKAARFVENVLGDPDRAEEIRDESIESYAERRKFQILENPSGGSMRQLIANPSPTRAELLEELAQLRQERDQLQQQLATTNAAPSSNPRRNQASSLADLRERIRTLREENDQLQDKLDEIAELAAPPEDGNQASEDELVDSLNAIIDVASSSEDEIGLGKE